jgi:tetratricopeptide (TPR) repeat protein
MFKVKSARDHRRFGGLTDARQGRNVIPSAPMARKSALILALAIAAGLCRCRPPLGPGEIRLGVSASLNDRWDEAVARWTKAVSADPSSAAAHNNLGVAYEKEGLWERARKEYEAALKLAPGNMYIQDNFNRFTENREAAQKKAAREKSPASEVRP